MRFSKKIVISIVALNVVFAAAVLVVYWHTGSEPSVTAGGWFAFTGTELWSLAKVTVAKNKEDTK